MAQNVVTQIVQYAGYGTKTTCRNLAFQMGETSRNGNIVMIILLVTTGGEMNGTRGMDIFGREGGRQKESALQEYALQE